MPPTRKPRWWSATAGLVRRALRRPARLIRRDVLPRVVPPARRALSTPIRQVRVVGLLSSASGLGKSGRLCIEVLAHSGYQVSAADVADLYRSNDGLAVPSSGEVHMPPGGLSIIHLNPPMLLPGLIKSGMSRYYRSYNVGYWAWELEMLPREWIDAIRFVNAVFVPSTFCQRAVRRYTDKPVLVVPHPVPDLQPEGRELPTKKQGPFTVLNIFNFGSSFERKNPLALVAAFRAAFGNDPGARLILKTGDGARHPKDLSRLRATVGAAGNVEVVDAVWSEARLLDAMRSADAYASLHRSEGFGLTLAEAIMAETPVVATNWSGNTDFCRPELCYPVDYDLVPFGDDSADYDQIADARWAEASVEHAAEQLRRVRGEPAEARRRAKLLKADLLAYLGTRTYHDAVSFLASGGDERRGSGAGHSVPHAPAARSGEPADARG